MLLCALMLGEFIDAVVARRADFQLVSPMVMLIGFVLALFVLQLEHSRLIRSSSILGLFWFFALIMGVVRLRTNILKYMHGIHDWYRYGTYLGEFALTFVIFLATLFREPLATPHAENTNPWFAQIVHSIRASPSQIIPINSFIFAVCDCRRQQR